MRGPFFPIMYAVGVIVFEVSADFTEFNLDEAVFLSFGVALNLLYQLMGRCSVFLMRAPSQFSIFDNKSEYFSSLC